MWKIALAILIVLFLWKSRESYSDMRFTKLTSMYRDSVFLKEENDYIIKKTSKEFEFEDGMRISFEYSIAKPNGQIEYFEGDSLVVRQFVNKLIIYDGNYEYVFNQ